MSKKKETGRGAGLLQMGVLMLIGAGIGGGGSVLFLKNKGSLKGLLESWGEGIYAYGGIILGALSLILFLSATVFALRAGKKYRKWDQEDEEAADKLDKEYDREVSFLTVLYILGAILTGILVSGSGEEGKSDPELFFSLLFLLVLLWSLGCIDRIFKYAKKMNPEKRGNFISWNFRKQWMASCDERERHTVYKAAYKAYIFQQTLYPAAFVLLILLSRVILVGILPFAILGLLWISSLLSYAREIHKES